MVARAGFYALALGAALVVASGAMLSDDAMAQADDTTAQADDTMVQADDTMVQADDVTEQVDEAPVGTDEAAAQDEAVEQSAPQQSVAADRPAKSNLDQSTVRAAPVTRSPRQTRTSTRAIAVPKILGSYR